MKNFSLFLFLCFSATLVYSQQENKPASSSTYIRCSKFSISKPLRDIPVPDDASPQTERDLPVQVRTKNVAPFNYKKTLLPDPVIQQMTGERQVDSILINFEGGSHYRPDATGAAGPNHYVQAVNLCNLMMFDKTNGNLLLATTLAALGGGCSDDPIVLYDKFADRWVIVDVTNNYQNLTFAVSTSPDPTGSYYIYTYQYPVMPDFPKVSIWTDGYYATYRNISNDTVGLGVFERHKMLNGDASAGVIIVPFPSSTVINANTQLPGSPKIFSCDGALPPYGSPNYLTYFTNVNCGDTADRIVIYKMTTDTVLHTCQLAFDTSLATAPFNAYFTGYGSGAAIKEPNGYSAWSLDGTFQYHIPYIKFTGYNSAVLCNTVNLGDSIAGIRWYELRQNDTTHRWSIYQQGTYGPNDSISRWNSSICMDLNGDISLAYNVTNAYNLYPGIRFTGRLASDPLGQMTFAEQTAITGTQSFYMQWGDYCESTLDPDGLTFWHTNQYITNGNSANTRIFSFRLSDSPVGIPSASTDPFEFNVYRSGDNFNVEVTGLPADHPVVVTLFDIIGKPLKSQWLTPASGQFAYKINISGLAKGSYLVRIGNSKFQKVTKVILN
jgi:hypothetical protein